MAASFSASRRVDQHRSGDMVWVGGREIERDQPTKAMADHQRALDPQLRARRRKVVGEQSHRVPLRGGIALAMAAKVHGDDPMSRREARDLLTPKTPITRRAMHEHRGRVTTSSVVVRQDNTITNQSTTPNPATVASRRERLQSGEVDITVQFSSGTAGRVTLACLARRAQFPPGARPWYARRAEASLRVPPGRRSGSQG